MQQDKDLKEAIEACAKIMQEKCGNRPFMLVATKADVGFKNDEDQKKGILTGTASFMYVSRPKLKKDGLSKLLIDTTRHGVGQAEKKIMEEAGDS
ncbi:MAG: hypothetical protein AB1295_04435 [Candidatus Micrarchaeota archaeon]